MLRVQAPPHPVEGTKRFVDAIFQAAVRHHLVRGGEVAEVVGVVEFGFFVVGQVPTELPGGFGRGHRPRVAFAVRSGVALRHAIHRRRPPQCQAVRAVAEVELGALDVGIAAAALADGGGAQCSYVPVVGQVLVHHGHGVRRQPFGEGRVPGQGLKHPETRAPRSATAQLGRVEEGAFRPDPPAVKPSALVEQVRALLEKGTVFVKPHLVGTEVQHEVVCHDLAKVRHERHVHGEGITETHLGVETAVDGQGPFRTAREGWCVLGVRTEIGEHGNAWRGVNAGNAAQHTALVDHALLRGVQGIPHGFFTRSPDNAPSVHAPRLFRARRQGRHAKLAPRNANLGGPPPVVNAACHLPNAVPRCIVATRRQQEIREQSLRRGHKRHGVDAVVVGAEPNAKLVRIFHAISHAQLLQNGIRGRVKQDGPDVQVLVVVPDAQDGAVGGFGVGVRPALREVRRWHGLEPRRFVQGTVNHRWFRHPGGHGLAVPEVEFGLGSKGDRPSQDRQKRHRSRANVRPP